MLRLLRPNVFIPDFYQDHIDDIFEFIDRKIIEMPETKNDYWLVNELKGQINIKTLNKVKVDNICREIGISPYEYCMQMMRAQNDSDKTE